MCIVLRVSLLPNPLESRPPRSACSRASLAYRSHFLEVFVHAGGEPPLASLRDAIPFAVRCRWCRRCAPQPPANRSESSGFVPRHPEGMPAISRGLSAATPPETERNGPDPDRGRSRFNQDIWRHIQFRLYRASPPIPRGTISRDDAPLDWRCNAARLPARWR